MRLVVSETEQVNWTQAQPVELDELQQKVAELSGINVADIRMMSQGQEIESSENGRN